MKEEGGFEHMRRVVGAVMGPLCALLIWLMPIGELSGNAHHMLAVMSLVAIWWITEPVPIPVTSLLGPTLCVVLGIAPIKDAFSNFANPLIFLFMGGFLLAKGMMVNGLDKRIAYGILSMKWVGNSPRRIFLAIGLACILCSGWISNTATAAMMFPIALGLLEAIREMMAQNGKIIDLKNYKYATGLMLMTAYACSIGGVMTPIGTPPNIIMLGFLNELAPQAPTVSFFQWMTWGTVAMIIYFVIAYIVLWRLFPADVKHIEGAEKFISDYVASLGKWTRAQKNTLIAFGVAVFLWVAPSVLSVVYGAHSEVMTFYDKHFPESIAAMVGGLLLFFLPVNVKTGQMTMKWKEGMEGIEWGTLLLFGGGLSMGAMMYTTGLSDWIGNGLKDVLGNQPSEWVFVGVFCISALILSEFTSHTAAVNLIGSIAITTAVSVGISPIPVAVGVALASSLGFMMPVSTPPNAIVYASGYVPITKMIKTGLIIDFFGILLVTVPVVILFVKFVMGL
ncbi:solute carrier family 13 (sodium-dependent dicarboxylate transporter), member 2/3/5 [Prevotella sp. tc2-28]|uniref:SLC13 family permease n=1 Tax=Prevotella sp. tc2-28 TaxID=1761888 RepID=UPI00089A3EBC|nr:DASS family sodium-coupled anion symporter [Prevotella sp. tc2-28]SEA02972.1 solute carrier family 13 (sodium-dependent dicarboxylate transporter), member 2/3/5 [Prevotella sp. tc2-28]